MLLFFFCMFTMSLVFLSPMMQYSLLNSCRVILGYVHSRPCLVDIGLRAVAQGTRDGPIIGIGIGIG